LTNWTAYAGHGVYRAPVASIFVLASPGVAAAAAPSVGMFGSFFPGWLICLFAAVLTTVVLRFAFIATGVDDILRWRVLVYMSMAAGLTFLMTYLFFGR
jgi:hypothetical protein